MFLTLFIYLCLSLSLLSRGKYYNETRGSRLRRCYLRNKTHGSRCFMRYIMYAVSTLCVLKSMKMLDSLVASDKVLPHERYSNYTVSFLNRSCTETVYDSAWSVSKVGELNRRHCVAVFLLTTKENLRGCLCVCVYRCVDMCVYMSICFVSYSCFPFCLFIQ